MKTKDIIAWAGVAATAWYGVLRGAKALFVGVTGFHFSSIRLSEYEATFVLDFVIKNPLFVGLVLDKIVGDVYIQGIKCGRVDNLYQYYVAGGKTHKIPVVVTLDLTNLSQAVIANIISGDVNTLTVSFNGSVSVGEKGLFAIPLQIDLGLKELM